MERQGESTLYVAPAVTDYGNLVAMTAAADPVLGEVGTRDLSFSGPGGSGGGAMPALAGMPGAPSEPGAPGAPGEAQDVFGVADTSGGGDDPGGGAPAGGGGGAAGGGGAGGGSLPFTGFFPGLMAAAGTAMTASGVALRRALRRRG